MGNNIITWKDIPGTEGLYQASSEGQIRSIDRIINKLSRYGKPFGLKKKGFVLTQYTTKIGYRTVHIHINGENKSVKVHRMVAKAFHENIENKKEINHVDGIKINNSPPNLEWCTRQENIRHAVTSGLYSYESRRKSGNSKRVKRTSINDGTEEMFNSCREAAIATTGRDSSRSVISRAACGVISQAYGFTWAY